MKKATKHVHGVDMVETLSLSELTMFCDTNAQWVLNLVEHGVVTPIAQTAPEWEFTAPHIARARKASRLMRDFGLSFVGVAFVLKLIDERDALAHRVAMLETSGAA